MIAVLLCVVALLFVHIGFALHRDERIVVSDPGNFFALVLLVYSAFPAAFFILTGFVPSETGDNRLNILAPGEDEVASLYWIYAAVIGGFVAGYAWFMRRAPTPALLQIRVRPSVVLATFLIYLSVALALFAIKRGFGLLQIEEHGDFYRNIAVMPLLMQQIFVTLSVILLCSKIAVIGVLAGQRRLWSGTALLLLAFELVVNLDFAGSRRDFVMLFLIVVLTFDLAVKPMKTGLAALLAMSALGLFTGYGFIRANLGLGQSGSVADLLTTTSEFTAMFATAYDVSQLGFSGLAAELRSIVLTSPFLSIIPQQISPFPKIAPADWYIQTLYPEDAEAGQGYAFGVVAEAVNGLGWIEGVVRGALIAAILAFVARRFRAGQLSLPMFVAAMMLTIGSFDFFRIGVFWFVPILLTRLLPFLAVLWLVAWVLDRVAVGRRVVTKGPSSGMRAMA